MSETSTPSTDEFDTDISGFLANLTGEEPKKESSTQEPSEEEATQPEAEETEATDEGDKGDEESSEEESGEADPDDAEVDIKVGEETHKVKLKDLKRLWGQEAALTQKSQALAAEREAASTKMTQATAAMTSLLEKAQEAYAPYADLDFLALSMTPEFQADPQAFAALRQDAMAAENQVKFLREELGSLLQTQEQESQRAYQQAAQECIKVLSDPKTGIEGWGQPLYQEITQFAAKHGMPQFGQSTSPAAYKLMHMAMQFEKMQGNRQTAEKKLTTAVNKPTTVMKPKASSTTKSQTAMQKLRRTGNQDDAVDAFLASFK